MVTAAGWLVAVAGAAWFASTLDRGALTWGLAWGGRGGGSAWDTALVGDELVPVAATVTGWPVAVAVVGTVLARRPLQADRGRGLPTSWSVAAVVGTIATVPHVLGCYAVSHASGTSEWIVLPMLWPQLTVMVAVPVVAVLSVRRARRAGRRDEDAPPPLLG